MKDLLVYVPPEKQAPQVVDYATSLAAKLDAHLEGTTFSFLPEFAGHYATLSSDIIKKIEHESEAAADAARRDFVARASAASVRHSVRNCVVMAADAARSLGRVARAFDLVIVPQTDRDGLAFFNAAFDDTIFVSGRPVLFVPVIHRGSASLDRILLCWNGDHLAARAAADALPLMKVAAGIDVLQFKADDAGGVECQAPEIVRHLERHGLHATAHTFHRDDVDVGAAILSFAADCGSTLVVMGGYGHSRAREILFGGATREILQSMTVPVFMSH